MKKIACLFFIGIVSISQVFAEMSYTDWTKKYAIDGSGKISDELIYECLMSTSQGEYVKLTYLPTFSISDSFTIRNYDEEGNFKKLENEYFRIFVSSPDNPLRKISLDGFLMEGVIWFISENLSKFIIEENESIINIVGMDKSKNLEYITFKVPRLDESKVKFGE